MKKTNRYFKILFIIAIILIPICFCIYFQYALIGKKYVKVNNQNENEILKMLEESNSIQIKGKIKEIGNMQGLGDWYLYIRYEDGSQEEEIFDDGDSFELYQYIKHNGILAGTKGMIVKYTLYTSVGIVIVYLLYKISMHINKKTDEITKRNEND